MAFALPLLAVGGGAGAAAGAGAVAAATATAGLTTAQVIGLGLVAGGTLLSGYSQYQQGKYEEGVAKANAKYEQFKAEDALRRGDVEESRHRLQVRRLLGTQRARQGASGVDINSGSPLAVALDTVSLGEMDAMTIRNNAAREAFGYRVQAENELARGKQARRQSRFKIGSTLLTGGADAYGIWRANK